jgi:hypothetical protein
MRRAVGQMATVSLLVVAAGCGGPKAYVRPGFLEQPPKSIAVLPFTITYPYDLPAGQGLPESHLVGSRALRKTFYYALTPLGYQDRKLADVDAALTAQWGPVEEARWQSASVQELGRALGVDAVIYGDLQRLMHFSTPLYTETSLTAQLRMVDTHSGEELWRKRAKAADRGGALLQKGQVVDFLQDQARSFHPEVKFLRIADTAVRALLKDFPNPALAEGLADEPLTAASRPRLALLPLTSKQEGDAKKAEPMRRSLAASLQEGPFEVMELQLVDAVLAQQAASPEASSDAATLAVANALGADVVLRGTVTEYGRTYAIVQSWVKAGLELQLIDGHTGQTLWMAKRKNSRQAGVLKGPTGYKSIVTAPITGLKGSHLERVAQHLTRMMAADLGAAPAVLAYVGEWRAD